MSSFALTLWLAALLFYLGAVTAMATFTLEKPKPFHVLPVQPMLTLQHK